MFRLETPGGGGFGRLEDAGERINNILYKKTPVLYKSGSLGQYSSIQEST